MSSVYEEDIGGLTEASWRTKLDSNQEDKIPVNYSYRPGLDVLAGRSERIKKNNLFYRLQIHQHFAVYNDCENHDKRHVAQLIVHAVQNRGGRFLDPQGKVMTDRKAVKKTMKALKDLRKTHGRNAPESLPPRLAKMTVKAQKQAAEATTAAAKLMELQHCLESEDTALFCHHQTPCVPSMFAPERANIPVNHFIPLEIHHEPSHQTSYHHHHHEWDKNAMTTMVAAVEANNTEKIPISPSEVTLEGGEGEEDIYEPLPLDYPTQEEYEPLPLDCALKEDACLPPTLAFV